MKTDRTFLKAYIIEDEEAGYQNLSEILKKYCPDVLLVGNAYSIKDAVAEIPVLEPDIVFLDIELPQENGFQLFKHFPDHDFSVVFTTAYSEYAIKAFNYSAIHYILKPIDIDELHLAIAKVHAKSSNNSAAEQVEVWRAVAELNNHSKIVLPTSEGIHFINTKDIIWCEAQSNYTLFFLDGQDKILVSKSLKVYDDLLSEKGFYRTSRSALVNINHVVHCSNHKKMELTMTNDDIVIVSERRRSSFKNTILKDIF